jgi:hypothetical protein
MLKLVLNETELQLVDLFEAVGYGEIYDVRITAEPGHIPREVGERTARCLKQLRKLGRANKIVVHDSEPAYMEIDQKINGFDCLIKTKL